MISKVKQLALKSLNIPNSTNPLDNGTITPEEALQSALDGLTFEEKNNVGIEIPTKGELTNDEQ